MKNKFKAVKIAGWKMILVRTLMHLEKACWFLFHNLIKIDPIDKTEVTLSE